MPVSFAKFFFMVFCKIEQGKDRSRFQKANRFGEGFLRARSVVQNLPCKIVETEIIQSEISEEKKLPAISIIVKKNA